MLFYPKIRYILTVAVLLIVPGMRLNAQYYDWGQEPASVKWLQIKTCNGRFVFPDNFTRQAIRLMHYMDTVRPHASYGFTHGPMKYPLLMHTQNFSPNGIVMLAPKRMELITTPPADTYAMPWLKQLAAHESRHAVQYNNANRGMIKALSYVLGQQAGLIGTVSMPFWMMEGDAVITETQMSAFGRGLQPSFTIDYRMMAIEGKRYRKDKYFSGSFKDNMPSHYELGYQMMSWAYDKYGAGMWDPIVRYGSRNPYVIFTSSIGLKKFYGTSVDEIFESTMDSLGNYWRSLPDVEDSSIVFDNPVRSFTTYSSPLFFYDGYTRQATVVALKKDLDNTSRIVEAHLEVIKDDDGGKPAIKVIRENILHRTGPINTGLTSDGKKLWWSELRQSTFSEQRINSRICWYDMATGKNGVVDSLHRAIFPAGVEGRDPAYVEYDYSGFYTICHEGWRIDLPHVISVHGLAYDEKTSKYYFIALDDSGMWIGAVNRDSDDIETVTSPTYSTLSNLRVSGGMLFYGSIASGKDEAYVYIPETGKQYRMTDSRYGSFAPVHSGMGEEVIVTTYTPDGYMLAFQKVSDRELVETPFDQIPANTVNPTHTKWNIPRLDTLIVADTTARPVKKFRKWQHLLQPHSWAPIWFEPDRIFEEDVFNIDVGVTLLSQNLLNSAVTMLGWRYTEAGSFFTGRFNYSGLPVRFEFEAEYGTMDKNVYSPLGNVTLYDPSTLRPAKLNNYFSMEARAYLPILLSAGYHIRRLTPQVEFTHENSKVYYPYGNSGYGRFSNGMQKVRASLQYTDNVRMATRDFLPRWGYALRAMYTSNPFNSYFAELWTGYARVYLPGVAPHHSLMLRGAVQGQYGTGYIYRQKELFPRGAHYRISPDRYAALAVDYQFPICYPDGGINSLIYFRRIRANLAYDYARYRLYDGNWHNLNSYGVDITFDFTPFRWPSSTSTSATITIHKPSDRNGVVVGASFTMPI